VDSPQIVGIGGGLNDALLDYVVGLARGRRVLFVGTAAMEDPTMALRMYEQLKPRGEVSFLRFNPWPPDDLRGFTLAQDAIVVGGGNTANMLAVWRVYGFDRVLREAWESGIVLTGWSAGMICWFEAGVTDSFGPQLAGLRDGLGFLAGSACPHYDGEELRRPVYQRLVAEEGFPPGIALDDSVAARFVGAELREIVSSREGAGGYRVEPDGERPLETRRLS
jgi:dipeptidase E